MQANQAIRLGPNHGYRFEGDLAFLNAELSISRAQEAEARRWALQLWACDAPYQGGPLTGIKVAEAQLALDGAQVAAEAPAQLPPAQRDYAMVLVLASGDQVHDFSNYPARQAFAGPQLDGNVSYRFEGEQVVLQVDGVRNPRLPTNLSGTLALELWALSAPYQGGAPQGARVAQVELGRLAGNQGLPSHEHRLPAEPLASGTWQLALLLREWSEAGYQTRDFHNFAAPHRVHATEPVPVSPEPARVSPAPVRVSPAPVEVAAPRGKLSVQTASVQELAAVSGLNLKLAQAIVRARPFASLNDLLRVRGIGAKLLQKLREELSL